MNKTIKKDGWEYLINLSSSLNRDERQISLIRSYSWIEHALGASGIKRDKKPISSLLHQAFDQNLLSNKMTTHQLSLDKIKAAIKTRHEAAHIDEVPSANKCKYAVETLRDTWIALKNNYVTLNNASYLAKIIMEKEGILSVNLYGSLSRRSKYPNDIDLLIFDDGRYSKNFQEEDLSYKDRIMITRKTLNLMNLLGSPINHVVNCRWLDVMILNGGLFGADHNYTSKIMSHQPDPYFFLNISSDIIQYNFAENCFISTQIGIFQKLQEIKNNLISFGLNV